MALNDREHPASRELPVLRSRRLVVPPLDARLREHDRVALSDNAQYVLRRGERIDFMPFFLPRSKRRKQFPARTKKFPTPPRTA
jgi:hypothetical protein